MNYNDTLSTIIYNNNNIITVNNNKNKNNKCFVASKYYIRIIYEGSCDTEDWSSSC